MFRRVLLLATLTACSGGSASRPITNTNETGTSLAARLEQAKALHKDVLLVSTEDGITAYTPDLTEVAKLTASAGRYLQADPAHHALYFFVDRRFVRLDLATGEERTVATVPALRHVCFGGGEDAVNPLDYIQRHEDVSIDIAHGFACLNVQDRNLNMMSVSRAYRIALDTGAVTHATTFTLDNCREPGEAEHADGPCSSGEIIDGPERLSPSRRWELVRDPDLGEQGDYIYSATLVTDQQTKTTYAVRADGLAKFDYAAIRASGGKAPEGTCVLPYETIVRWFPNSDVALIVGCTDGDALFVRPPATAKRFAGNDFAFY